MGYSVVQSHRAVFLAQDALLFVVLFPLLHQAGEFALDADFGDGVEAVDEEDAVEVVDLMLEGAGEEAVGFHGDGFAVEVGVGDFDLAGAADVAAEAGKLRQPSSLISLALPSSSWGFMSTMGMCCTMSTFSPLTFMKVMQSGLWETSMTASCTSTATCGAARPTPLASRIVSSMSAARARISGVTSVTGRHLARSTGSG